MFMVCVCLNVRMYKKLLFAFFLQVPKQDVFVHNHFTVPLGISSHPQLQVLVGNCSDDCWPMINFCQDSMLNKVWCRTSDNMWSKLLNDCTLNFAEEFCVLCNSNALFKNSSMKDTFSHFHNLECKVRWKDKSTLLLVCCKSCKWWHCWVKCVAVLSILK